MNLYKYKGILDDKGLNALEKNYFWGAHIDSLNDPCEALYNSNKFFQQSDALGGIFGKRVKTNFINLHQAYSNILELNKKLGVFSLSQKFDDELLWAHYGCSHKGYCIEYDFNILQWSYGNKLIKFPVSYSRIPPELDIGDALKSEVEHSMKKLIGHKSKRWAYEQEVRIVTENSGKFFYVPEAVTAVIFGLRMDVKDKEVIMDKLKGRGVKFYQIHQKTGSYYFERRLINDPTGSKITYLRNYSFHSGNVQFQIFEKKYSHLYKRGELKLKLNKTVALEDILELSQYLREQLFCEAETVYILFYQTSQYSNDIAWSHSQFRDEKWNVGINEFVLQ